MKLPSSANAPSHHPIASPWLFFHTLSIFGLILGFVCFYISMTPMLLPRSWLIQTVCCAVSGSVGYAVGKFIHHAINLICLALNRPKLTVLSKYRLPITLIGLLGLVAMTFYQWQIMQTMRDLMDMPKEPLYLTALGVVIGVLGWLGIIVLGRWIIVLIEWLVNLIAPKLALPIRVITWVLVTALVGSVLIGLTRHYVWRPALQFISQKALELDLTEPESLNAPITPNRSGVDGISTQPWQALGHYGQRFVSLGPSAADISSVTGKPALEPIRVFVGLDHEESVTSDADALVALALKEMDRTGAWQRSHLVIHGATGRGWVEEYSSLAAEYLTDGDIASVSIQYSYLPSQISFIVDRQASSDANQRLYQAIQNRLSKLDPKHRPKLYLAGESLGAFATQSNFQDYNELISSIDGAVWVGTPRLSELWSNLVKMRADSTPENLPIIDGGRHVRFMDYPEMLSMQGHPQGHLYENWQPPRIVFVQYASDPIVWWSPDMLYQLQIG